MLTPRTPLHVSPLTNNGYTNKWKMSLVLPIFISFCWHRLCNVATNRTEKALYSIALSHFTSTESIGDKFNNRNPKFVGSIPFLQVTHGPYLVFLFLRFGKQAGQAENGVLSSRDKYKV